MRFWTEISGRLAALTGSASPEEVRAALNEFDVRDVQAVRVSEGGGGGSQTVRVIGPFHFDYTDFPTENTTIELFTPTAGDWILRGFIDPATGVFFNDSGSIDFSLGEAPDFNASSVPGTFWGNLGPTGDPSDAAPNSDNPDSAIFLIGYRSTGLPLKIRAQSVVGDGSAGEMDLFFLVATPSLP